MTSFSSRGTSTISPLRSTRSRFCSTKTTAIGLPRLALVVSSMERAPLLSRRTKTAGRPSEKPELASISWSPVTMVRRLSSCGAPVAVVEKLAAERRATALLRLQRVLVRADQAELQGRGGAEHALGLRRVLHAGQLHDDAVQALALHHRLGHAELVDAVAQRHGVLLDREIAALAHLVFGHA